MNDLASHLVDNVIPSIPTCQWVLSLPFHLRYHLAKNAGFLNKCHQVFIRILSKYYILRAKSLGHSDPKTGSLTYIQRFGGSPNLNIHFHVLSIDGVYIEKSSDFHFVKPPTDDEQRKILKRIYKQIQTAYEKIIGEAEPDSPDIEQVSMSHKSLLENTGQNLQREKQDPVITHSGGIRYEGFSLHCGVAIGAKNRKRLEKLLRYIGRGPLSESRLSNDPHKGKIIYQLKTPWSDGNRYLNDSIRVYRAPGSTGSATAIQFAEIPNQQIPFIVPVN